MTTRGVAPLAAVGIAVLAVGAADAPGAGSAAAVAVVVGRSHTVLDRRAGTRRPVALRSGSVIRRGDVVALGHGAILHLRFRSAARQASGRLFAMATIAKRERLVVHLRVLAGSARFGPRLAARETGGRIALAVGKGVDAPARITAIDQLGRGQIRMSFDAPPGVRTRFACRVDHGSFRPCRSPVMYSLRPGRHVLSVRTTSLYGLFGPSTTRDVHVGG